MSRNVLPEAWNEWTLAQEIGRGSFGTVYKAQRTENGRVRESAVKIIEIPRMEEKREEMMRGFLGEDAVEAFYEKQAQEFMKEARHMELVKGYTNIVQIEDSLLEKNGLCSWTLYLRMELLRGLDDEMRSLLAADEARLCRLGADLCRALICCEQQHLYHRDIKPANLFLTEDGSCKLGDFGISMRSDVRLSKARMQKETKGTILYMAPEVLRGEGYSRQADIYSAGMVLYRLSLGEEADGISGQELQDLLQDGLRENRKPQNLSVGMWNVIRNACAEDPALRYESAAQMLDALLRTRENGTKTA